MLDIVKNYKTERQKNLRFKVNTKCFTGNVNKIMLFLKTERWRCLLGCKQNQRQIFSVTRSLKRLFLVI